MKKLFAGCFLMVLLAGFMAGCGGGGSPVSSLDTTGSVTLAPEPAQGEVGTMSLSAGRFSFRSVADTYLSQSNPGVNYGTGRMLAVGNHWPNGQRFGMVRFDLSKVPANAVVTRAILQVYMLAGYQNPSTYTVHRVMKPWTETAATWTTHSAGFAATPADSWIVQPAMVGSYVAFSVKNLASRWIVEPATNYGCLLRTAGTDGAGTQFGSREYRNREPRLVVDYTVPHAGPAPVFLGTAANYVILTKTGVTTTGTTAIVGNVAVSPAAHTYLRGFGTLTAGGVFATSPLVTGKLYAANMKPPTPANLTTAIADMATAYTDAAGRSNPDFTNLYGGDLSGRTLVPGLYKWGTNVAINSDATLNGGPNDVWILQTSGNLIMAAGKHLFLTGGAQAKNIFWQVAGYTTLGTTADFKGIVLCKTNIAMRTGALMNGRALAQTAVTLDANAVNQPAP